jgi:2-methylcitrate dehydratase PrpD
MNVTTTNTGDHLDKWATKELAQFAVDASFESYPADTIDLAKMFILDNLGCMIGGTQTALGQSMLKTVGSMGGEPQATVIGTDLKIPTIQAALINGTTANALDFDETLHGLGHPSSTVIPAAFGLGEREHISGRDLITAVLVGFDVGNRIGRAIQPTYERLREVWNVGTWQTFGAVSAAAKILGLDLDQTLNAYGTAGATAPLPNTQKWGWDLAERPIHWAKEPTGWPSWTGLLAAELASNGFVGNRFILDGDNGFWIMAGSDRCDFHMMTEGLGEEFEVRSLSIKPYSSCRWQHAALDCVDDLKAQHGLTPEQVQSVVIHTFDWLIAHEIYEPKDMVDAEFSLPHVVAMVLRGQRPGPDWFTPEALYSDDVIALSRKVTVVFDEEINQAYHDADKIGARVEITTTSGANYRAVSNTPKGDPANPVSHADVEDKFRHLAAATLGVEAAEALVEGIGRLEELDDISTLFA